MQGLQINYRKGSSCNPQWNPPCKLERLESSLESYKNDPNCNGKKSVVFICKLCTPVRCYTVILPCSSLQGGFH